MILINTQKRTLIFALQEYDENQLSQHPRTEGFPEGVYRLTTSTNDVPKDVFLRLCEHPDFQTSLSRGHILMVGKDEIVRKVPFDSKEYAGRQLKKIREKGKVGVSYVEMTDEEMAKAKKVKVKEVKSEFVKAIDSWPKKLSDLKNLAQYENEQDAMAIAEYTVDLDSLKRWDKAEKQSPMDDHRVGVLETLKTTITKILEFNSRVAKAKAGDTEAEKE